MVIVAKSILKFKSPKGIIFQKCPETIRLCIKLKSTY